MGGTGRRPGRPRSPEIDRALDQAVLDILARDGFTGMRVDDVAAAAGVSKTTIYRRASTKVELVVNVLQRMQHEQAPVPDTGSIEDDLRALVYELFESLNETPLGIAMAGLVAEKAQDPALAEGINAVYAIRQDRVRRVVRRGIRTGGIRRGLTEAAILDMLTAPAYYRLLVSGEPLNRAAARRHADALVAAVAT